MKYLKMWLKIADYNVTTQGSIMIREAYRSASNLGILIP